VADLLRYVRFEPEALLAAYRDKIEAADLDALDAARRTAYLAELAAGLSGFTYLEP